jgi:hypothetical protein
MTLANRESQNNDDSKICHLVCVHSKTATNVLLVTILKNLFIITL